MSLYDPTDFVMLAYCTSLGGELCEVVYVIVRNELSRLQHSGSLPTHIFVEWLQFGHRRLVSKILAATLQ